MRQCDSAELLATKRLLNTYFDKNHGLTEELKVLKNQLAVGEKKLILSSSYQSKSNGFDPTIPVIYLITPTYARMEQKAELTRLSHTFLHVRNIHWIVVEDADSKSELVTNFLENSGLNYTHLFAATPQDIKMDVKDPNWLKPRGVLQRNEALSWLRMHTSPQKQLGVVYFADDDNTYSLKVFDEVR